MKKAHIASAVIAALLAGGIATAAQASSPATGMAKETRAVSNASADGKALFTGLYFGQGPIGSELVKTGIYVDNTANQLEKNDTPDGRKAVAKVIELVEKDSPRFFEKFSANIRSGNPYKVEKGLNDGVSQLEQFATDDTLEGIDVGTQCGVFNVVAAANVAVALNAVSVGNVLTQVNLWIEASDKGNAQISKEEATAKLTEQLRAL